MIDLIWESALVHFTGGIDSVFIVFYVITILGSALVLPAKGSIWTTLLTCIIFSLLILFEFVNLNFPGHFILRRYYNLRDWFPIFYLALVRMTIFGIVGYLGTYLSVRIYNLEKKLKNQEQLTNLGELTARIAHEIKNPLTAISGTVEVLSKELEPQLSDENKHLMQSVVKETRRLKNILTSILDYSRVDTVHREYFDLSQAIEEVLAVAGNAPQKNGKVHIIKTFDRKPLRFYGDSNRIKQMLFNLVLNAYEAMPVGGDLVLTIRSEGEEQVVISIMDSGKGISKEMQKVLFQPFHSTKHGGTGLGLAIVQKIVENHGGKITVRSQAGLGTEFIIQLPLLAK
ncbi:MAG: hypothetical protein HZC17_06200 [Candidatus Omnitrophica bacterium]|nr:hypothetical protein [Candidatus Omnitrophota bacterium]